MCRAVEVPAPRVLGLRGGREDQRGEGEEREEAAHAAAAYAARAVTAKRASAARTTAGKRSAGSVGHAHGELRLARTRRARSGSPSRIALAPAESSSIGVTARRSPAEGDVARAGAAELDPRLLEQQQVGQRLGHRAEAVLELLAQLLEVGDLAGRGDPAVDVDLGLLVGDVVGGDVGVDVDVEAHRLAALLALLRPPSRPRPRRASAGRARSRAPRRGPTARRRAGCRRRGSRGRAWRCVKPAPSSV